jgi:hypothetical protein
VRLVASGTGVRIADTRVVGSPAVATRGSGVVVAAVIADRPVHPRTSTATGFILPRCGALFATTL